MPYIYSLASMVTRDGYTMMRHLVFNYPSDSNVFDTKSSSTMAPRPW